MLEMNLYSKGMLTLNNIDRVAELLIELLSGEHFATVSSNELLEFMPKVMTNQRLNKGYEMPIEVNRYDDKDSGSDIAIHDTNFTWLFSTTLENDQDDGTFNNPYFAFDGNKVTITHRAPDGWKIYVVFMVEEKGGHSYS